MRNHKNIGLFLTNASDKKYIIEQIMENKFLHWNHDLSALQGELYSSITINRLIEEELHHDHFLIQTDKNSGLSSMSSGERKKALLNYLISKKPQYIVLDDVYSNIDKETQQSITNQIAQLADSTLIIQLFFRICDMLPCIETVYTVDENNKIVADLDAVTFRLSETERKMNPHHFTLPNQYDEIQTAVNDLVKLNSISDNSAW